MVQTCSQCSRVNPVEAVYCYFDGFVLAGQARHGGPVAVGAQAFPHPFVFADGRQCRNFEELALACQEDWAAARDLLLKGYLKNFFSGLGRADLVLAAKEAARFPDPDRGLDQLLAKLPTKALAEPRLRVETLEINLGILEVGEGRDFHLHLENQGMRLLYGTIACSDGSWLALGDSANFKHFQFLHEQFIPIRVRADKLRATPKPWEAHLEIESNGGSFIVLVRAFVPIKPFAYGALAGARSPRQLAEKARANTKEAAVLFENGAVAEWYRVNGWTYPVQGPVASGLGAVQQFFEALGLTAPPKVEISTSRIDLHGNVGDLLHQTLEVKSDEKRPVYAHAVSNQPWLEVGPVKLNGRRAIINLSVPSVPDRQGETLTARLVIQSNGNQRFVVPVSLQINHNLAFGDPPSVPAAGAVSNPAAAPVIVVPSLLSASRSSGEHRRRATGGVPLWLHVVPAVMLFFAVLSVVLFDLVSDRSAGVTMPAEDVEEERAASSDPYYYAENYLKERDPLLTLRFNKEMKFGLEMSKEKDPNKPNQLKRLTYEEDGGSNNTIIQIDGSEYIFGETTNPNNRWDRNEAKVKIKNGMLATMDFLRERIRVTQHVQIVPGQSGYLDTCLVHYTISNRDNGKHKVGIRVMLDTYIGANDGVPFTIPGVKGFVETKAEFERKRIPDYIEVVERPDDPKNPGTVARLGLRHLPLGSIDVEDMDRLLICRWPGSRALWDWKAEPMNADKANPDSCVVLYWPYQTMNPQDRREVAFTYGLGSLEVDTNMALSVPGSVPPNTEFIVTAYVWRANTGEKVKLHVPNGLHLADGESAEKTIGEGGARRQVFWHLRSGDSGTYTLEAHSDKARAKPKQVIVKRTSIFG